MSSRLFEIPKHWKWVTLDDIGIVVSGGTPSTKEPEFWNGYIPWITPADLSNHNEVYISKGSRSISQVGLEYSSAYLLPANSIVFSSRAPIGYVAITKNELATNQGFKNLIVPNELVNPKYVYYYLKTVKELAENMASGTTFLELSATKFRQIPFPLAPFEEQNRIVEILESNFDTLKSTKKELNEQIKLIPAYKQLNIDKFLINDGKKSTLNDVAILIDYRGKTPKKTKHGIRLITAKNIKKGYVTFQPEEFISENDYDKWMTRGIPQKGDVFITTEAPLGNVAQYSFNEKIALAQRIITLHPLTDLDGSYLKYYLMSSNFQRTLLINSTGTTVKGIKSEVLKKMIIYYPKINIQKRVIAELDNLMELSDKLKNDLIENFNKIEKLEKKILQQAFQGKLVNQLNTDTSTDILLKNIQKEKEQYLLDKQEIIKNRPKIKRMEKEKLSIIQVLKKNKKPISAKHLWEQSMYNDNIEKFYSELKMVQDRIIEEKTEKGSLISLK